MQKIKTKRVGMKERKAQEVINILVNLNTERDNIMFNGVKYVEYIIQEIICQEKGKLKQSVSFTLS